jgi:hypothetical protein
VNSDAIDQFVTNPLMVAFAIIMDQVFGERTAEVPGEPQVQEPAQRIIGHCHVDATMTLNITVATPRCIYQSADYRLFDWTSGHLTDFDTQKIVLTNNFRWTATICFAGVGRTHRVDVGAWLAERIAAIQPEDPLERLFEELQTADEWLAAVPSPKNRHSFSVGAFVGGRPIFALVSNFEAVNAPPLSTAGSRLSVTVLKPVIATTFVSGDVTAVNRGERRRLSKLAAREPDPQHMYEAMASLNRSASERSRLISPACFTTHVRLTGEGGGTVHSRNRPFMPEFAFPRQFREVVTRLLDEQFGPGRAQLRSMSSARAEATDEFHRLQIREKPTDPNSYSNYGAFLKDKRGDSAGAEGAYRKGSGTRSRSCERPRQSGESQMGARRYRHSCGALLQSAGTRAVQ